MLLAIVAGMAAAFLPVVFKAGDLGDLLLIESSIVLVSMILVLVRRKTVRERCARCGSDVEAHFLATTLPPRIQGPISPISRFGRLPGPTCRICTDLESDRAARYPVLTKFDDNLNPQVTCPLCGRHLRKAQTYNSLVPGTERTRGFMCRSPLNVSCARLAKRSNPQKAESLSTSAGPQSPQSPKRDP